MITASAYVMLVPEHRRDVLLHTAEFEEKFGEPVAEFDHSRRAPLIVLMSFEDGHITHLGSGKKGMLGSGGTGLIRLNVRQIEILEPFIAIAELVNLAPPRVRVHVARVLEKGGLLPPKSLDALMDALIQIRPELAGRLARFSERRAAFLRRLTAEEKSTLALQKETVTVALQLGGVATEEVLTWTPSEERPRRSFLEGLPGARVREDAMLITDFSQIPGFNAVKDLPYAAKEFADARDPESRLVVIMANRLALEAQTGADLIYYNEPLKSFVMVQYKAMEEVEDIGPVFRWQAGDQLSDEIARMDQLLAALQACPADSSPTGFRLHQNPFFLKICRRQVFNPDDKGLFPGMYFPLDLWKCLAADKGTLGPRGGRYLSYENASRRLSNAAFLSLVVEGWIGTTLPQSTILEKVITTVLETGKTVTFAVKQGTAPTSVIPEDEPPTPSGLAENNDWTHLIDDSDDD